MTIARREGDSCHMTTGVGCSSREITDKLGLSLRLRVTVATWTLGGGLWVVIEVIGRAFGRGDDERRVTADDNVTRRASERHPGGHISSSACRSSSFPFLFGIALCKPFKAKLVRIR